MAFTEKDTAFVDSTMNCARQQFLDLFLSPWIDFHDRIMPVFNAVLSEGPIITVSHIFIFGLVLLHAVISPDSLNLLVLLYTVDESLQRMLFLVNLGSSLLLRNCQFLFWNQACICAQTKQHSMVISVSAYSWDCFIDMCHSHCSKTLTEFPLWLQAPTVVIVVFSHLRSLSHIESCKSPFESNHKSIKLFINYSVLSLCA